MHWQKVVDKNAAFLLKIDSTKVPTSRWTVTVACLYATSAVGPLFVSGVYSASLKAEFLLSQRSVELISVCMYAGGLLSVFVGAAADRLGPRSGLRLSFAIIVTSLSLQYCVLTRRIPIPDDRLVLVLCVLGFLQYIGSSFCTYSAIPVLVSIYDPTEHRALILGVCKTYNALMGALLTQTYKWSVGSISSSPRTFNFILYSVVVSALCTLLPSFVITTSTVNTQPYVCRVHTMVVVVLVTCVVATSAALVTSANDMSKFFVLIIFGILFAIPFASTTPIFGICVSQMIQSEVYYPHRISETKQKRNISDNNDVPTSRAILTLEFW
jgi:hypothetical protein